MKITVPFIYEALVIKKRCSNPIIISVRDSVVVEVIEKKASDLPVAFKIGPSELRWDGVNLWDFDYANTYQEPERVAYLTDVVSNTNDNGENYKWSCAGAEAPFKNFWHRGIQKVMCTKKDDNRYGMNAWLSDDKVINKTDSVHREWVDDNRLDVISRAKSIAANILAIDCVMHTTVSEPRYNITTFGMGNNHGSTGLFVCQHYNDNLSKESYFTALEYSQACEYADRIATGRGDNKSIPVRPNGGHSIEVMISAAVQLNPNKDHGEGSEFLNNIEEGIAAAGSLGGVIVMAQQLSQ